MSQRCTVASQPPLAEVRRSAACAQCTQPRSAGTHPVPNARRCLPAPRRATTRLSSYASTSCLAASHRPRLKLVHAQPVSQPAPAAACQQRLLSLVVAAAQAAVAGDDDQGHRLDGALGHQGAVHVLNAQALVHAVQHLGRGEAGSHGSGRGAAAWVGSGRWAVLQGSMLATRGCFGSPCNLDCLSGLSCCLAAGKSAKGHQGATCCCCAPPQLLGRPLAFELAGRSPPFKLGAAAWPGALLLLCCVC